MTRTADPFDELAALFLTEPDKSGGSGVPQPGTIDVLVVGHLPVRAGLWLVPYADAVARQCGPTVLLRLDDDVPHLQLLRGSENDVQRIGPTTTLRDAIRSLIPVARRWVVCPGRNGTAEQLILSRATDVTLIGGVDEAARVAAYKQVKELVRAAEQAAADVPRLSMAIVGCDERSAQSVFDGMNKTTSTFLGVRLSLALTLPQMDAGVITAGFRQFPGQPTPTLAEVLHWIREEDEPLPAPMPPETHPADLPPEPPEVEPPRPAATVSPARPTRPMPTPSSPAGEPSLAETAVGGPWIGRRTVKMQPKAEIEVEPKHPVRAREPQQDGRPVPLAQNIEGLAALPVRCPGHESVELAVDAAGRLHLLGRDDALRRMHVVQRWAVEHRELIGMACPDCDLDARRPPRLHLFTDKPVNVSDLHGSQLRLHVLAPVRVGEEIGWYVADLNDVEE